VREGRGQKFKGKRQEAEGRRFLLTSPLAVRNFLLEIKDERLKNLVA
jgi:hypothetical protein